MLPQADIPDYTPRTCKRHERFDHHHDSHDAVELSDIKILNVNPP